MYNHSWLVIIPALQQIPCDQCIQLYNKYPVICQAAWFATPTQPQCHRLRCFKQTYTPKNVQVNGYLRYPCKQNMRGVRTPSIKL